MINKNINWSQCKDFFSLYDADEYYAALIDVLPRAQKRIVIIGWDIDSRTILCPKRKLSLKNFLISLVQQNPNLEIKILCWDFSIFLSQEREWKPWLFGCYWDERIHFVMDHHHPIFSSHHEKIVLIDDQLSFIGGIDICENRLDDKSHQVNSGLRLNSKGQSYKPFHDIQILLSGDIVTQSLKHTVNQRWERATGEKLDELFLTSDHRDTIESIKKKYCYHQNLKCRLVQTRPKFAEEKGTRENLRVTLELLKRATKFIYIENQYLTNRQIVKSIGKILKNNKEIQVTIVLPKVSYSWLENHTIYCLQQRSLKKLLQSDINGNLRIVYPRISMTDKEIVYVHSKLISIDDKYFKVGSSNLNHRSMGMDSESDVVFLAENEDQKNELKKIRLNLLSEHLDVGSERINELENLGFNVNRIIDLYENQEKSLQKYPIENSILEKFMGLEPIFDRSKPIRAFN